MIWLLSRLVVWPAKVLLGTTKVAAKTTTTAASEGAKAGFRLGRVATSPKLLLLVGGVGVGLLIARRPGSETRDMLRTRLEERGLIKGGGSGSMPSTSDWSSGQAGASPGTGGESPSSTSGGGNGTSPADLPVVVPDVADTDDAAEAETPLILPTSEGGSGLGAEAPGLGALVDPSGDPLLEGLSSTAPIPAVGDPIDGSELGAELGADHPIDALPDEPGSSPS